MVTKIKSTIEKEEKKGKVKVGKLQRNREAVTDLSRSEQKQIKGDVTQTKAANAIEARGGAVVCPKWVCGLNHNETLVRDALIDTYEKGAR